MTEAATETIEDVDAAPTAEGAGDEERISGEVKWFDVKKGFGFIAGPKNEDVFVHFSAITGGGFRALKDGEAVTYVMSQGDKGLNALDVQRVTPPEDASPKPAKQPQEQGNPGKKSRRKRRGDKGETSDRQRDSHASSEPREYFPDEKPTTVGKREELNYEGLRDDDEGGYVG
jgi:CspA family cold shock protein